MKGREERDWIWIARDGKKCGERGKGMYNRRS